MNIKILSAILFLLPSIGKANLITDKVYISIGAGVMDNGSPANYQDSRYSVIRSSAQPAITSLSFAAGGIIAAQRNTWQEFGIEFGWRMPTYYMLNTTNMINYNAKWAALIGSFAGHATSWMDYKFTAGAVMLQDNFGENFNSATLPLLRFGVGTKVGFKDSVFVNYTYIPGKSMHTADPLNNLVTYSMSNVAIVYTHYF